MLQLTPPQKGETIAILHTNMGDISLRFFPEETPKAYENFITHAKNGYYNGVIFHRVISDFMIQGGDPEGTGRGGESIWGHGFGQEFSRNLRHFRGALAMAQSSLPNSIGSQFYIVQSSDIGGSYRNLYDELLTKQNDIIDHDENDNPVYGHEIFPTEMLEKYLIEGGAPFLDYLHSESGYTVFGHVITGLDVVDAIAAVEKGQGDRPIEDVVIESVTVTTFE